MNNKLNKKLNGNNAKVEKTTPITPVHLKNSVIDYSTLKNAGPQNLQSAVISAKKAVDQNEK